MPSASPDVRRPRARRRVGTVAALVALGLVLAGCSTPGQPKDFNADVREGFLTACETANEDQASADRVAETCVCWFDALASDARTRIAHVRDGLRSILQLLSATPGTVVVVDVPQGPERRAKSPATVRAMPPRGKVSVAKPSRVGQQPMAKASRSVKAAGKGSKGSVKKRSRASA